MALIACPECKNEFSDQARACPHCGRPWREAYWTPARILLAIVLGLFVFAIASRVPDMLRRSSSTPVESNVTQQSMPASNNPAYEAFTENSTYVDVVSSLGKPSVETPLSKSILPMKLACYANLNLCIAFVSLKPKSGVFHYVGSLRINPAEVLHHVNREGGDSAPLMEFLRGHVAKLWADVEKEAAHK